MTIQRHSKAMLLLPPFLGSKLLIYYNKVGSFSLFFSLKLTSAEKKELAYRASFVSRSEATAVEKSKFEDSGSICLSF